MKKKKNNGLSLATKRKLQPYLYIAPIMILLLLMFGYPLIKSIVMSFQDYKLTKMNNIHWNNFKNYKNMFADKNFKLLLKNSLVYVICSVLGQFLLGLGLALALNKKFPGSSYNNQHSQAYNVS